MQNAIDAGTRLPELLKVRNQGLVKVIRADIQGLVENVTSYQKRAVKKAGADRVPIVFSETGVRLDFQQVVKTRRTPGRGHEGGGSAKRTMTSDPSERGLQSMPLQAMLQSGSMKLNEQFLLPDHNVPLAVPEEPRYAASRPDIPAVPPAVHEEPRYAASRPDIPAASTNKIWGASSSSQDPQPTMTRFWDGFEYNPPVRTHTRGNFPAGLQLAQPPGLATISEPAANRASLPSALPVNGTAPAQIPPESRDDSGPDPQTEEAELKPFDQDLLKDFFTMCSKRP
jgi:hypothetical protein